MFLKVVSSRVASLTTLQVNRDTDDTQDDLRGQNKNTLNAGVRGGSNEISERRLAHECQGGRQTATSAEGDDQSECVCVCVCACVRIMCLGTYTRAAHGNQGDARRGHWFRFAH
jgi:hypothetical protein